MLKGKNVIVTGATRGIGKEIALTLAQNGANIAINYRNYNDEIVELINALKEFGADVLAIKCDVRKTATKGIRRNFNYGRKCTSCCK